MPCSLTDRLQSADHAKSVGDRAQGPPPKRLRQQACSVNRDVGRPEWYSRLRGALTVRKLLNLLARLSNTTMQPRPSPKCGRRSIYEYIELWAVSRAQAWPERPSHQERCNNAPRRSFCGQQALQYRLDCPRQAGTATAAIGGVSPLRHRAPRVHEMSQPFWHKPGAD